MSNDERPDSLAAQAATWVPPWEREPRMPDREYQAAAEEAARAELAAAQAGTDEEGGELSEGAAVIDGWTDEDGEVGDLDAVAGPEARDDPASDDPGSDDPGSDDPGSDDLGSEPLPEGDEPETPFVVGGGQEVLGVDSPAEGGAGLEPAPTEGELGPELPVPGAVEEAVDHDAEEGVPADLPLTEDDAGDVFDAAADDDVSDDDDVDLASPEIVPGEDDDESGPAVAQLTTQPEATSIDDRARVASAVPEQGRRRRNGPDAVGDGWARNSPEAEPDAEREVDAEGEPESGELPALMEDAELAAALEAILLVVDEPVAEMQLAQILEQPTERIAEMLEDLSARYTGAGHGFDLRRAAGGWRLYTRPEYAAYVERFVLDGQSVRLTQAALETLAVVAYKQPVTRSRISAIRGVNCDGVMRTLVTRGLIEECGTESETGAHLYRTTPLFLEKLGLNSVDQLPPLAPFLPDDVEEVLDASG